MLNNSPSKDTFAWIGGETNMADKPNFTGHTGDDYERMSNPNDFQCDICGNTLTSESCNCSKCKSWLCNGCAFEDECEERQGI